MENQEQPVLGGQPADAEQPVAAEPAVAPVENNVTAEPTVEQLAAAAQAQQPKKKKSIAWVFILLAVVLIGAAAAVFFLFFFNKTKTDELSFEKKTPAPEAYSAVYKLKTDYEAGQISIDEYVKQLTYVEYDSSKLDKKYKSDEGALVGLGNTEKIVDLIVENKDKISQATKDEFAKHYYLKDVTIEKKSTVANAGDIVLAADKEVPESYMHRLDSVTLSSAGNFLIWYTTTGEDAITDAQAKSLGDNLEKNIATYAQLTGYNYSFTGVLYDKENGGYEIAKKRLADEPNIPVDKLTSAMNVYVYDTKAEYTYAEYSTERCLASITLCDIGIAIAPPANSAIAWPHIVVNKSSFGSSATAAQVINHELFHHFQNKLICPVNSKKYDACAGTTESDHYNEALANYFSAKVTDSDNGFLNDWAGYYGQEVHKGMLNIHSGDSYGYGQFPYFYSYDEIVDGGLERLVLAHRQTNPYAYLVSNTEADKMKEVINDAALRAVSKDYGLKALKNEDAVTYENEAGENFDLKFEIPAGAIHYYTFGVNWSIEFSSSDSKISAVMIGKKNGKFSAIKTSSSSLSAKSTDYSEYTDLVLAITNADLTNGSDYSLKYKQEDVPDAISLNHRYDNYAVEYTMDLDFGIIKTTATGKGVVDEKHQRSYLSSTISTSLISMDLESYSDFYNGVDFYTNPQKAIGGGILDLLKGDDEEEMPKWLKTNSAKHTIDIDLVARKVRSAKESENLGNGHFKLKMTSKELNDLMDVANSGDDQNDVEFKNGTVDVEVYINEYGRVSKIVYDFGPLVPGADKFTCEMKVFDYNRAGDILIPESIRYGATEE